MLRPRLGHYREQTFAGFLSMPMPLLRVQQPLLIGEDFSPWTQKARWALEVCGIPHAYQEYTPVIGETALRWRTGNWRKPATVPVLITSDAVYRDSWAIACHADSRAAGRLIPERAAVMHWNALCDHALAQARIRVLQRMLQSPEALDETVAGQMRWCPASVKRPAAKAIIRRLARKYAHLSRPDGLRNALVAGVRQLCRTQTGFLLSRFSYADIALAVVVETIAPSIRTTRGPATLACWADEALAREFADLVAWRNGIAGSPNGFSLMGDTE